MHRLINIFNCSTKDKFRTIIANVRYPAERTVLRKNAHLTGQQPTIKFTGSTTCDYKMHIFYDKLL